MASNKNSARITAPNTGASSHINIWDGTPVDCTVKLIPFLATGENRTDIAVIICPGGSYFWLDYKTEGIGVARWLQSQGINAFVLRYRVAGYLAFLTHYRRIYGGNKFPKPIQDAQRAIQILRQNADRFGIDPHKIGIMGFSAGGHLSMLAAECGDTDYLKSLGVKSDVSLAPDFAAPIYPVVTLSNKEYVHKRSQRAILGEKMQADPVLSDSLSLEKHVNESLPPIFLMNCKDDPVVNYHNSELLAQALKSVGARLHYVQYSTGGHGFGASDVKGTEECRQWRNEFISWLKTIFPF